MLLGDAGVNIKAFQGWSNDDWRFSRVLLRFEFGLDVSELVQLQNADLRFETLDLVVLLSFLHPLVQVDGVGKHLARGRILEGPTPVSCVPEEFAHGPLLLPVVSLNELRQ